VSSTKPFLSERLEKLQRLQDLDIHLQEAKDPKFRQVEEGMGFVISAEGLNKIQDIRDRCAMEMAGDELFRSDLRLYERIRQKYDRAVERIEAYICLGCYATQPKAGLTLAIKQQMLPRCENCGRILYWLVERVTED
jgi:predicted  nucleic acid-binding Zn-ribbon protein